MIQIIGWLACGVCAIGGGVTCIVLASGRRARTADAMADAWYRRQAERRLLTLCEPARASAEEMVVYRNALSLAMRRSRVEREAEDVARRAWA